ncbi:DUF2306 domain-containing protein [Tritonibacter scottomollicae]|nr:DUF2306 domain-containing protein [Tritonibacter scottomollicae]
MASISLFSDAPPVLMIHVTAALSALALTPMVLWRQRRGRLHKVCGYFWVTFMAVTALSAFGISNISGTGWFSPLHALAVLTLWSLWYAIRAIRRGDVEAHRKALRNLATGGLGVPMVLIFLPGRRFSNTFFADTPWLGLMLAAAVFTAIAMWRFRRSGQQSGQRADQRSDRGQATTQ